MSSQEPTGIMPRYFEKFSCLGDKCPDTCCKDWAINLEYDEYMRLKKSLPETEFRDNIKKIRNQSSEWYATINIKDDGTCPFYDASDRLCKIHKNLGESYLGQICKQYPRQISLIGKTIEASLSLSCPEAARLCITGEDSTSITGFDPREISKNGVAFYCTLKNPESSPYTSFVNDLREVVLQILSARDLPFETRLFISLAFSKMLDKHVYKDAKNIDPVIIESAINELSSQNTIQDLHDNLSDIPESSEFSESLIKTIILSRLSIKGAVSEIIMECLKNSGINSKVKGDSVYIDSDEKMEDLLDKVFLHYKRKKSILRQNFGLEIDLYLENYSRNMIFKDLFILSDSLLDHIMNLAIRVSIIKLFMTLSPSINEIIDNPERFTRDESLKILEDCAINAIYRFSRGIEHDRKFIETIQKELKDQNMDSFAHTTLLIKF